MCIQSGTGRRSPSPCLEGKGTGPRYLCMYMRAAHGRKRLSPFTRRVATIEARALQMPSGSDVNYVSCCRGAAEGPCLLAHVQERGQVSPHRGYLEGSEVPVAVQAQRAKQWGICFSERPHARATLLFVRTAELRSLFLHPKKQSEPQDTVTSQTCLGPAPTCLGFCDSSVIPSLAPGLLPPCRSRAPK